MESVSFYLCHTDYEEAGQSYRRVQQLRWGAQFSSTHEQMDQEACRAPRRKEALPQSLWEHKSCTWENKSWPILLSNKYTWKWVATAKAHDIIYISFITLSKSDLTIQFTKALLIGIDRYVVFLLNCFFSFSIPCSALLMKKETKSWLAPKSTDCNPTNLTQKIVMAHFMFSKLIREQKSKIKAYEVV